MQEEIEKFIAQNNQLRILRGIDSIRLASTIDVPGWEEIRRKAEAILHKAGISTLTRDEYLEGNSNAAMLLFKWGVPSEEVGIAQLILFADMQIPNTEELHVCPVWISQSLLLLDMRLKEEMAVIILNEIRQFAGAFQKACSLPECEKR